MKTTIVRNYLIDLYLPFLPLEKRHVMECIKAEAIKMNYEIGTGQIRCVIISCDNNYILIYITLLKILL